MAVFGGPRRQDARDGFIWTLAICRSRPQGPASNDSMTWRTRLTMAGARLSQPVLRRPRIYEPERWKPDCNQHSASRTPTPRTPTPRTSTPRLPAPPHPGTPHPGFPQPSNQNPAPPQPSNQNPAPQHPSTRHPVRTRSPPELLVAGPSKKPELVKRIAPLIRRPVALPQNSNSECRSARHAPTAPSALVARRTTSSIITLLELEWGATPPPGNGSSEQAHARST